MKRSILTTTRIKEYGNPRCHLHYVGLAAMMLLLWTTSATAACQIVVDGSTYTVSSSIMTDCVDVLNGGQVFIASSVTLTCTGIPRNISTIDGAIYLQGSGSTLAFSTTDHQLVGAGSIDGQHDNAMIKIAGSEVLINSATISGNCQIVPLGGTSAVFINNGIVHANNAGTLEVAPHLIGVGSGVWQVSTSSSAVLRIGAASTGTHSGSVNVSNGTLDVDYDFATTGNLSFTGGTIDIASGVTLSFW